MLVCDCTSSLLDRVNKKLALIGEDLLFSKKYGFKRKYTYDQFYTYFQYKQILESNCNVACRILEKIRTK